MNKKDLLISLFFLAVSTLIFLPMFISDKLFSWLDFIYYFLPFRELTAEIIKNGNVPLWNPYIFCGNPLMANLQSAVFYPLNVLYYVLPFAAAVKVQTLLAFFIASFSMYALARSYKTSRLAAMLAGSVFAFGFYLTVRAVEMADLHVIIWIPAIILMARKYAAFNRFHDLFLLALCLAMSFFGGHPQVFSYAFILFTAFYFFECSGAGIKAVESIKKYLLVNIVFAVFIIVQLAPTLEFMLLSKRAAEGVGASVHLSTFAGIEQVIAFFFPFLAQRLGRNALFIDWMALIDIGIPSVLLFISGAILMRAGRLKTFLLSLFALAAAAAFAGNFKIYEIILQKMPLLGAIEYASKINVVCVVIIALLVAFGFDALIDGEYKRNERTITLFYILSALAAVGVALIHIFHRQAGGLYTAVIAGQKAAGGFGEFVRDVNKYIVSLVLFTAALLFLSVRRINRKIAAFTVFTIAFAAIFSYHTAGYDFYAKQWAFFDDTENGAKLKNEPGIYDTRILAPYLYNKPDYTVKTKNNEAFIYYLEDSLLPNIPMQKRFFNADGFDSLQIASFNSITKKIRSMDRPWDNPAFSLLSAGYIISKADISGKYIKLFAGGYSNVYKYSKAMPAAYFMPAGPGIVFTDNVKEIIEGISSDLFEPGEKLFLEDKASGVLKAFTAGPGRIDVILKRENTNTCVIKADTALDGFIIINENYYPGWKAYVNGQKTDIYRANHTFKAIAVKKGRNEIKLIYDPDIFKVSVFLSVFGLIAALGYFIFGKRGCTQKVS